VFAPIDTSDQLQTAGNLDQQIDLVTAKLSRLRPLVASGSVTRASVTDAEIELKSLERRRASLKLSQARPEPLVAPIDGVLASMKVMSGQVVSSQDQLFHLVDTKSLWVEALVFDPTGPTSFTKATATVQNGAAFDLSFVGEGRILQQQSTVLNFAIVNPPPSLRVGTPVSVLVPNGEPIDGLLLPKAALLRASNGDSIVWLQSEPEVFTARTVRSMTFDGDRVLIAAGLKPEERVVVRGAELINQVR
jgi:membrane fusion protein, heavy metal efflux system